MKVFRVVRPDTLFEHFQAPLSLQFTFSARLEVIGHGALTDMMVLKNGPEEQVEDVVIYRDSSGVTHFITADKCRTCEG
jgi:hypothetical protein